MCMLLVVACASHQQACFVVQVLIAGGSAQNCAQYDTPASNQSYLVDVTPGADHTPIQEAMTYPRVVSVKCAYIPSPAGKCNMTFTGVW